MIRAGITGGIGSGKSTVCKVFEILGVPVYYADDRAKKILDSNGEVVKEVVKTFGQEILDKEKKIDRKKLAALVFNDKEKLEKLNKIVHPAVGKDFQKWCEKKKDHPYILKEAAILFESGAYKNVDQVITVTAPVDIRIKRVTGRDGVSAEEVVNRMSKQMTDEEKIRLSSYVIVNDEQHMIIPQVLEIDTRLRIDN